MKVNSPSKKKIEFPRKKIEDLFNLGFSGGELSPDKFVLGRTVFTPLIQAKGRTGAMRKGSFKDIELEISVSRNNKTFKWDYAELKQDRHSKSLGLHTKLVLIMGVQPGDPGKL